MESTSKHRLRPKLCRFGLILLVLAAAAAVLSFSCKASPAEETEETETDTYYKLTLSSSGSGTVSALPPSSSGTYKKGSVVTLTAVPASGYYLGPWAGTNGTDVYLDGSAWKIVMNADKAVTAAFTLTPAYTLSVATGGGLGTGTVALDPSGAVYTEGTVVKLTPAAALDSGFNAWGGTDGADLTDNGDGSWSIAMNADKSVTAAFGRYSVALGSAFTLALKKDGTLWVCGVNDEGQLGIGTAGANEPLPVAGPSISNVTDLAAGSYHGLALMSSGEVYAWGVNTYGQCGNGTTGSAQTTPVQVSGLAGVKALAGGQNHSLALKTDGTVWAWGLNTYGQCGDGTTTSPRTSPVKVSGLAGVAAIAAGGDANYALLEDGTVRAWGENGWGQLGDNGASGASSALPVQVSGLTGVRAIAAGTITGYALLADGTVRAWGGDNSGQLGNDAALNDSSVPVQVTGVADAVSVHAANGYHAFAVTGSGAVLAWGRNTYGQLGDGTTTNRATPVSGPSLSGIALLTACSNTSFALLRDGTLRAWGSNSTGQLGQGASDGSAHTEPLSISW